MTTPANEWREDEIHRIIIGIGTGNIDYNQAKKDIQNLLTTVAQEAMEERDTYWKERVEKLWGMLDDIDSVPDMLHPNTERGHESTWRMMVAIAEKRHKILKTDGFTLTPITNEDNLK